VKCEHGHSLSVDKVLSSSAVHESVVCPACFERGATPPGFFNRQTLLAFFDEENKKRIGQVACPICNSQGFPSQRILDILAPEVFLSYNWGAHSENEKGVHTWSTQEMVKQFKREVEYRAEVLCWLDVEGGLAAGQDHVAQMVSGMQQANITVIFLSDRYVNSPNCLLEFALCISGGNFLIPVLVPQYPEHETDPSKIATAGWTGPGEGNTEWWIHAQRTCTHKTIEISKGHTEALDWEALKQFEPIDLRKRTQEETVEMICRRLLSRVHRINQHKTTLNMGAQKWRKFRILKAFVGLGKIGLSHSMRSLESNTSPIDGLKAPLSGGGGGGGGGILQKAGVRSQLLSTHEDAEVAFVEEGQHKVMSPVQKVMSSGSANGWEVLAGPPQD